MAGPHATRTAHARLMLAICGSALTLGTFTSCAKQQQESSLAGTEIPRAFVPAAPFNPGNRPVSEPVLMGRRASLDSARLVAKSRFDPSMSPDGLEPTVIESSVGEVRSVKLSVAEARVPEVLHALLGPDGLSKSYVVDPEIMSGAAAKTITMDIDEEMTAQDIRDLLDGLGRVFGWTIQDVDGIVYVRPLKNALAKNAMSPIIEAMAASADQGPVIRVHRLRYVSPSEVKDLLTQMVSEGGQAVAVGRQIVLIDTAANTNRIARLLSALDVPSFSGTEIWTYRLANRTPEDAKSLLDTITGSTKLGASGTNQEPLVSFVALPGTSKLMVISRDPTVQAMVQDFIGQVDQAPDSQVRNRYVYRIQYYDPAALLNLINSFFADRIESSGGVAGAGGGAAPGGAGVASGGSAILPGTGIRLTLDPKEELLLIQATTEDYADLLSTLRMIDRARQQVVLSSIIAEVRLSNTLEYGVEYFLQALDQEGLGILELAGGVSDLITGTPTASAFFTGADGFAIIKALERVSDVSILQQPHLTVMDGNEATLLVGGETPVPKGDLATDTGAVQTAIEYRPTGITLAITPKVNESGDVTLNITQEINNVLGQTDLGPEFVTRKIETSVTVPHGGTLLLGGIIDTTQTRSARKIPVLADAPLVGGAFQSKVNEDERNELLLAITPRIVNTPNEGQATLGEFMMAARGLQRAMYENAESLPAGMLNETVREPLPAVRTDAAPVPDAAPSQPGTRPPGLEDLPPGFLDEIERRSDADPIDDELVGPPLAFGAPLQLGPPVASAMSTSW